jgi:hypothetical protein
MENLKKQIEKLEAKHNELKNLPLSEKKIDKKFIENYKKLDALRKEYSIKNKLISANKQIEQYNKDVNFISVFLEKILFKDITNNDGSINKNELKKIPELNGVYIRLFYQNGKLNSIELNRERFWVNYVNNLEDFKNQFPQKDLLNYDDFVKDFSEYQKALDKFEIERSKYVAEYNKLYKYSLYNVVGSTGISSTQKYF